MIHKRRFILVAKDDEHSLSIKTELYNRFIADGWEFDELLPELIVTIGGDGTFLRAIHTYMHRIDEVAFVGIHTGTLGFFTNYKDDELDVFFEDLHSQCLTLHPLPLLGVEVNYQGEKYHFNAINEIRVENVIRTQLLKITIDGKFLETYRGTGFCISTQAGSTAYNRSLGGAILHEGLDLLQLTEITGIHHHAYRSLGSPLIVKPTAVIQLSSDNFDQAILCYDHLSFELKKESVLTVAYQDKTVHLLTRPHYKYIDRLKSLF